jgi:hypothetical protein
MKMSSLVIEDGEMERGKRTMGKASADGAEIIECGGGINSIYFNFSYRRLQNGS